MLLQSDAPGLEKTKAMLALLAGTAGWYQARGLDFIEHLCEATTPRGGE